MSRSIDEKVVEMRFDNSQFESNVKTSMSTLEKLKQSLKLGDAAKGLNGLSDAAKKVDLSPISNSIENVKMSFSALDVFRMNVYSRISNATIDLANKISRAFIFDPPTTGFNEYELKMGSVQTIMASTGATLEEVNGYLDELNTYSDKTIYSFSDMTNSIGKFTNAGVKLDDAVLAIKGISNEAAVSGANANEASRAMYNFAQALSAGYVKLIDWKSIENANMATVEFKQQLINSAVAMGTLTKQGDEYITKAGTAITSTKNFNDSLQDQWMTTDVLVGTLREYADETTEIGKKAYASAQDVKTFSMMMDTLKEAAQSGWAQTWELLIGDFEQSKSFWTELSETLGNVIGSISDARNNMLKTALGSSWDSLKGKIEQTGVSATLFEEKLKETLRNSRIPIDDMIKTYGSLENAILHIRDAKKYIIETLEKFTSGATAASEATDNITGKLEEFQGVVNSVIRGNFGNGAVRIEKLTEAGYDHAQVQALVNKVWARSGKTWNDTTITAEDLAEVIGELSSEEREAIGITDEQAEAMAKLAEQAKATGTPISELIDNLNKPSGRQLLIEGIMNSVQALKISLGSIKEGFSEIFTSDRMSAGLYSLAENFNKFSKWLIPTAERADQLKRIFKGLAAAIDLITTVTGGGLKFAIKLLCKLFGMVDVDVFELTARLGDNIVALREWLYDGSRWTKLLKKLGNSLLTCAMKVKDFVVAFSKIPAVQKVLNKFAEMGSFVIEGLKKGLEAGANLIPESIKEIALKLIDKFKEILGIHSPSTVFFELGGYIIEGLVNGIKNGASSLWEHIKEIASGIGDFFKNIEWGKLFAVGVSAGSIGILYKIASALQALTRPMEGLGDVFSGVGRVLSKSAGGIKKVLKATSRAINAFAFSIATKGLLNIAIALGILTVALIALTFIDGKKLWNAVGVLTVLGAVLAALAFAVSKIGQQSITLDKNGLKIDTTSHTILAIGLSLLAIAGALKIVGSMSWPDMLKGVLGMTLVIGAMAGLMILYGKFVKGKAAQNIDKAGKMMLKLSISLLLMVGVIKLVSLLKPKEILKGVAFVGGFVVFVGILAAISSKMGDNMNRLTKLLTKLSISLLIMVGVVKLISLLEYKEMLKGAVFAVGFAGFMALLLWISKIDSKSVDNLKGILMSISGSMLIMAIIVKMLGKMKPEDLVKGELAVYGLVGVVALLVEIIKHVGNDAPKIAATLMAMAIAIGILAAVTILMGLLDVAHLAKGLIAVGILSVFMSMLMKACKNVRAKSFASLIVLTVAIVALAGAVAALSMIDTTSLIVATASMSAIMGMFALVLKCAQYANGSIGPLIVLTVAVGVLGGILYTLATLPWQNTLAAALAISLVMGVLTGVIVVLSKLGPMAMTGATSMLAISAGLLAMGAAFMLLAMGLEKISGVGAEGALKVISSLQMVLIGLISTIPIIVAAVGSMIVSICRTIVKVAPEIGKAMLAIITTICSTIIEALPVISEAITAIVVSICEVVINCAPSICEAITTVVTEVLESLRTCIPLLINVTTEILTKFLETVAKYTPRIVQAGMNIIISFLQGIAENIQEVVETAIEIVVNFIEGVASKLPDVIQAGFDLMISFINGLADAINNNTDRVLEAGINLIFALLNAMVTVLTQGPSMFFEKGWELITNLISGMGSLIGDVGSKVWEIIKKGWNKISDWFGDFFDSGKTLISKIIGGMGDKLKAMKDKVDELVGACVEKVKEWWGKFKDAGAYLWDGFKEGLGSLVFGKKINTLDTSLFNEDYMQKSIDTFDKIWGINSPSKVMMERGRYICEGLVIGLDKYSDNVNKSTLGIGEGMLSNFNDAMTGITDIADGKLVAEPTIRPVVDMGAINTGTLNLGANIDTSFIAPINSLSKIMADTQSSIEASNAEVVSAITSLRNDLNALYDADDQEIALYVDSKKLASSLVKPMNRQLNILSQRGAY